MTELTNPIQPDSNDRTWHILERGDGSVVVYYTRRGYQTHYMVYDTLDSVTDQQAEIDRLHIKNERLRAALNELVTAADPQSNLSMIPLLDALSVAREALAGGE